MRILVKTTALGVGCICFCILIFFFAIVVCRHRRKRELGRWKRHERLLRWICGGRRSDTEDAVAEHHGHRHGSQDSDLCSREVIPLRSSNVVDNPNYLKQTETRITTSGDSLCLVQFTDLLIYLLIFASLLLLTIFTLTYFITSLLQSAKQYCFHRCLSVSVCVCVLVLSLIHI